MNYKRLILLSAILITSNMFCVGQASADDNYSQAGQVYFWNIQNSLGLGEPTYYLGTGNSPQIGKHLQTGSIQPISQPLPNSEGHLVFSGVQGPNPFFFGLPIHVIHTRRGMIFCTWEAEFTIAPDANGNAIFSGVGHFTVIGGTRRYRRASGEFTTLFATGEIPLSTDTAIADVEQFGTISR